MSIGDVTSNERGSGARFNSGKPDLSLIPLNVVALSFLQDPLLHSGDKNLIHSLQQLGYFQTTGRIEHLDRAINLVNDKWLDCARVFEYGRAKYAAWNWSKGMVWSAPLACAGRHALKILAEDEANDDESGLPHVGHYLCNLVMLRVFYTSYPEGNDLPRPEMFAARIPTPADDHFA
jgi:hypothetical protein